MSHLTHIDGPECDTHAILQRPATFKEDHQCTLHGNLSADLSSNPPVIKILVVEDNQSSADILCLFFKMEGYDAECAYCGEDALNSVVGKQPEIIFLDLGLPDMSGYEVAAKIRSRAEGGKIHLIALTGRDQDEDRRNISEAGFDQHVVKPPAPAMLREALKKATSR